MSADPTTLAAPVTAASVVEDVLRQLGRRLSDRGLASRRAEQTAVRRNDAAAWLRATVGAFAARDLPAEPSEEEFRLGLRNGQIMCNALNKIIPGAVPKVVVATAEFAQQADGTALSAFQYFENVRNFLVAVQELGLPTFEASDLEQGGKSTRIVDCILALKSYGEWKQSGGVGSWKYGGSFKPLAGCGGKGFHRKSLPRTQSMNDGDVLYEEHCSNFDSLFEPNENTSSLKVLVNAVLSDKRPDEVPMLIESLMNRLAEEFERHLKNQNEMVRTALKTTSESKSFSKSRVPAETSPCEKRADASVREGCSHKQLISRELALKQHHILEQQSKNIEDLKRSIQSTKSGLEFMQMKYSEELCKLGRHVYGLAHAASNYHKVLDENRRLYNEVQDLKGSIRVYCRVRPIKPGQISASTVGCIDEGNITIITPSKYGKEGRKTFTFNKVFGPSATQDDVFLDTQPLIRSVLDGYNVCIFAYGQTGSGKTYTMSGPKNADEHSRGVNFRALNDLFKLAHQRKAMFIYEIAVQMIEIYNEQVRDLLANDGLNKRLEIRNNSQNGHNVPEASLVRVASTSDVLELMNIGLKNRAVGATALNDRSSRSHSCLTVHVQGKDLTSGTTLRGCMHLVDLAGSERVDKSEVTGERLKEAQHINRSLSSLGDVIAALAQKSSHVPYRNSKLTQLLQDSLGGQAKTLMFVHISPEIDAVGETISTLKFAERVSTVELGAARLNKDSGDVKELKEQIARLKTALAMKESGPEPLQCAARTPEISSVRASSPCLSDQPCNGDYLGSQANFRQPMEEVGNIEVRSIPPPKQKKPSFNFHGLLQSADTSSWQDSSTGVNALTGEENEAIPGEWVDKVVVNNGNASISWGGADFFYKRLHSSVSSAHELLQPQPRFYSANTDDSDELETSDSSESDALWQYNILGLNVSGSNSGSKVKKSQTRPQVCPDQRTPVPLASRKALNGTSRSARQIPSSGDAKRNLSSGKLIK